MYSSWLTLLTGAIMQREGCPTMLYPLRSLMEKGLRTFLPDMSWICHQAKNTGQSRVKAHGAMGKGLSAVEVTGWKWWHLRHPSLQRTLTLYSRRLDQPGKSGALVQLPLTSQLWQIMQLIFSSSPT